jgi:hypothetical protein
MKYLDGEMEEGCAVRTNYRVSAISDGAHGAPYEKMKERGHGKKF